jgi:hypothetical protein
MTKATTNLVKTREDVPQKLRFFPNAGFAIRSNPPILMRWPWITRLFNPRRDKWTRHFRWEGPYLVGKTSVGRTTIVVLAMNHPDAVAVRQSLTEEGLFPPKV